MYLNEVREIVHIFFNISENTPFYGSCVKSPISYFIRYTKKFKNLSPKKVSTTYENLTK